MPNSLTRVLSVTLGFSPHLPVSVYGTDTLKTRLEAFLGGMIRVGLRANALLITSRGYGVRICLELPPTCLNRHIQSPADLSLPRPPIAQTLLRWYRNIQPVCHRLRRLASA
jgi:hypothetical protein